MEKTSDPYVFIMGQSEVQFTTKPGDFLQTKELSFDNPFEPAI